LFVQWKTLWKEVPTEVCYYFCYFLHYLKAQDKLFNHRKETPALLETFFRFLLKKILKICNAWFSKKDVS